MGGHKPKCIITDQDPAMKAAIAQVFTSSVHRFCIWHIMRKLSEKVGYSLNSDDDFNTQFKSCVYNSETPSEFEKEWKSIIDKFDLHKNTYFRNVFLGAVLRTTSRSESENSFFSNFTNPHVSLVEFWMRYESAIELQRHSQSIEDNVCSSSKPELRTNRDLERHASEIYTFTNFYKFQKEFWMACMDCEIEEKKEVDDGLLIKVIDVSYKSHKIRHLSYSPQNYIVHCSCKMFECEGIPCRHILCVLKGKCLSEVPSYYILNRWTKMAASKPIFDLDGNILEGRDPEQLTLLLNGIKNISTQLAELQGNASQNKTEIMESFLGLSAPVETQILPPKQSNTKGSGSGGGKRLKGGKEVSMEQQQKKKRHCKSCGKETYHDSRNCPLK
ncbi:Protein FAR1-RELATED SEQUENCE 5, partial [Bienertia sinuspersici]